MRNPSAFWERLTDDLPLLWEANELQDDGIILCHAIGGQLYITKELKRLRTEYNKMLMENDELTSTFFIRPVGLTRIDIDLTRHEC